MVHHAGGVRIWGARLRVGWVTVDAPLITLEDINRGLWPASIEIRNGTVFSYAMNNYWYTDAPAQQGGQFTFRYALTSDPDLTPEAATLFSLESRSPLLALRHVYKDWIQTLPVTGSGFLQLLTGRRCGVDDPAWARSRELFAESPKPYGKRD